MLYLHFLVLFIHVVGLDAAKQTANQTSVEAGEESYKRAISPKDAFSDDFDTCMVNQWIADRVLRTSPTLACGAKHHARLCYGFPVRRPNNAQFISCYNTLTLIPEFTAHVAPYSAVPLLGYAKPKKFRQDNGLVFAPTTQAKHGDCNKPTTAIGNYFCSRGHLTPNGDFNTKDERDLTYIMTNIAPQWQTFNEGNWEKVERAVRDYVSAAGHGVYVFTGTAEIAKYWGLKWLFIPWKKPHIVGDGNVVVPKYFWKAVCDPVVQQSIVFIAENNVNVQSTAKVAKGTCLGQPMTQQNGVVYCYSVATAQTQYFQNWWPNFVFPDFDPTKCGTANIGTFLDKHLKFT